MYGKVAVLVKDLRRKWRVNLIRKTNTYVIFDLFLTHTQTLGNLSILG